MISTLCFIKYVSSTYYYYYNYWLLPILYCVRQNAFLYIEHSLEDKLKAKSPTYILGILQDFVNNTSLGIFAFSTPCHGLVQKIYWLIPSKCFSHSVTLQRITKRLAFQPFVNCIPYSIRWIVQIVLEAGHRCDVMRCDVTWYDIMQCVVM